MSIRIGYLLPTRERIMAEQPQAAPLLELAERAGRLGFDSVWASARDQSLWMLLQSPVATPCAAGGSCLAASASSLRITFWRRRYSARHCLTSARGMSAHA